MEESMGEGLSHMDTKHKIILVGGGILVLYFLYRALSGKSAASNASSTASQQQAQNDQLLKQVQTALGAVGAQESQFMQQVTASQQQFTGSLTDQLGQLQKSNQDFQKSIVDQINQSNTATQGLLSQLSSRMNQPVYVPVVSHETPVSIPTMIAPPPTPPLIPSGGGGNTPSTPAPSTPTVPNNPAWIAPASAPANSTGWSSSQATTANLGGSSIPSYLKDLSPAQLQQREALNSQNFQYAPPDVQDQLHQENVQIQSILHPGASYDPNTGRWSA